MWVAVKSIVAGDVVYYAGSKYTVESARHGDIYSYVKFENVSDSVRLKISAQIERVS